jgi:hypothetical protein
MALGSECPPVHASPQISGGCSRELFEIPTVLVRGAGNVHHLGVGVFSRSRSFRVKCKTRFLNLYWVFNVLAVLRPLHTSRG